MVEVIFNAFLLVYLFYSFAVIRQTTIFKIKKNNNSKNTPMKKPPTYPSLSLSSLPLPPSSFHFIPLYVYIYIYILIYFFTFPTSLDDYDVGEEPLVANSSFNFLNSTLHVS